MAVLGTSLKRKDKAAEKSMHCPELTSKRGSAGFPSHRPRGSGDLPGHGEIADDLGGLHAAVLAREADAVQKAALAAPAHGLRGVATAHELRLQGAVELSILLATTGSWHPRDRGNHNGRGAVKLHVAGVEASNQQDLETQQGPHEL